MMEQMEQILLTPEEIGDHLNLDDEATYPCSDGSEITTISVDALLKAQLKKAGGWLETQASKRWRDEVEEIFKLPLAFPRCPDCDCEKTVSKLIAQEMQKGTTPAFSSLKQLTMPLEDPRKAVLSVRTLIIHWDICAKCGKEYCTKVEIQNAPIKIIGAPKP